MRSMRRSVAQPAPAGVPATGIEDAVQMYFPVIHRELPEFGSLELAYIMLYLSKWSLRRGFTAARALQEQPAAVHIDAWGGVRTSSPRMSKGLSTCPSNDRPPICFTASSTRWTKKANDIGHGRARADERRGGSRSLGNQIEHRLHSTAPGADRARGEPKRALGESGEEHEIARAEDTRFSAATRRADEPTDEQLQRVRHSLVARIRQAAQRPSDCRP